MKSKRLIRTIALALSLVSLPVVDGLFGDKFSGNKLGIVKAYADTLVEFSDNSADGKVLAPLSSISDIKIVYYNNKINIFYVSNATLYALIVDPTTGESVGSSKYISGLYGISQVGKYTHGSNINNTFYLIVNRTGNYSGDNAFDVNMTTGQFYYSGCYGDCTDIGTKNLSAVTTSSDYSIDGGTVSKLSIGDDIYLLDMTDASKRAAIQGKQYAIVTIANDKIRALYSPFSVKFLYNNATGSQTNTTKSSLTRAFDSTSLEPTVPKDTFNYKVFNSWDKSLGVVTSNTVYNAVYDESEDSFWEGDYRYGIVSEEDKTVCFLGSRNPKVVVPSTVVHEGVTYTVSRLQGGCLSREGNITDLTVNSSLITKEALGTNYPLGGDSCLENLKITGSDSFKAGLFPYYTSLVNLDLKEYTGAIGSNSFQDCSNLQKVTLAGVSSIGSFAFSNCTSLTTVNLKEYTGSIQDKTFLGCTSLTTVDISSASSITASSFSGCTSLDVVKVSQDVAGASSIENAPHKVYLYDPTESYVVGSYFVSSGVSMLEHANKVGKDWTRISGSPIGNVTQNSEYKCNSLVTTTKIDTPNLSTSSTIHQNRETNVDVSIN